MQLKEREGGEGEPGTSSRGAEDMGESYELRRKQKEEANKMNRKNRKKQKAGKNKGKGKEIVEN